jgi:nitroreductase
LDALEAIQTRNSAARLRGSVEPGHLEQILKAGFRAPDHALLRPWRILVIEGEARDRLGALFAQAKLTHDPNLSTEALTKVKKKPLRAPLILVVATRLVEHPNVPEVEQILSAGAMAQNLMLAAHALGYGSMWRTGSMAYDQIVAQGLGLEPNEKMIGFLYVGQIEGKQKALPEHDPEHFVTRW